MSVGTNSNEVRLVSGFEDDDDGAQLPFCVSPEHNPPTHLHIPAGKRYRHVCPVCGQQGFLRGAPLAWLGAADGKEWPECSGDPKSCPENEGFGCCKSNAAKGERT